MKIKVTSKPLGDVKADALVVIHEELGLLAETEKAGLKAHLETFARDVAEKRTRAEWFCTLEKDTGVATRHLLLESVTFTSYAPHDEPLKMTAARAVGTCRKYSLTHLAVAVHHELAEDKAAAILEGIVLGDFQDTRFKGQREGEEKSRKLALTFVVPKGREVAVRQRLDRVLTIASAQNTARELVNAPHHVLTPEAMAAHARKLGRSLGLQVSVIDEKGMKREGFQPTFQVGRGSEYPPRLIVVRYRPKKARVKTHVALVGKGMTFDSGGLNIKGPTMHWMNYDMAGAAAVLGAVEAVARLGLPIRVTGVVAAAHNAVDGAAYHPGAILTAKNGKTIYVDNTDAEGRLVLTDALWLAGRERADVIMDFATLTGAVSMALGDIYAGLFTDDEVLRNLLLEAGQNCGEELWPLPLCRELESSLNHHLADIANRAKDRKAGATHAANFLKQFVPDGARWAHVDIAGVARAESSNRYFGVGGTGFGVRLCVEALRLMVEHPEGAGRRTG